MKTTPPQQGRKLRIIGGKWRGRKLDFPPGEALRPTGDRIRETLFNWLAPELEGARCLDLYAGSGSLGWEALSRGAAAVCFVDSDPRVAAQLNSHRRQLSATHADVVRADALDWLGSEPRGHFDLVFLDPPFQETLLERSMEKLARGPHLAPDALVYLEYPRQQPPGHPPGWERLKEKAAGRVGFSLYRTG